MCPKRVAPRSTAAAPTVRRVAVQLPCSSSSLVSFAPMPPNASLAGELLDANANLVLQLARPFAADPTIDNLISIRPGQSVG